MERARHIVIAGGGIGGLTTAIALSRKGFRVTVLEKASELRPVGAGIVLAVNALAVFRRIGIADELISAGAPLTEGIMGDFRKGVLAKTPLAEFSRAAGVPMVAYHRAELHDALRRCLAPESLRLGSGVSGFEQDGQRVHVILEDGGIVEGDVLVAADGLHSVVRKALIRDGTVYSGQTSWRGVTRAESPIAPGLSTELWGPGRRFGYVALTGGRVYWFAVADAPAGGIDPEGGALESLKRTYADWPLNVPAVLEATPASAVLRTDIQDRNPVDHWGQGRITLLGDAAHPMTPNLGQGAGQAIEDALVLSEELSATQDPLTALRRYEARRIPRTTRLVLASRKFGAVAHWSNPVARAVRNAALKLTPTSVTVKQFHDLVLKDAPAS